MGTKATPKTAANKKTPATTRFGKLHVPENPTVPQKPTRPMLMSSHRSRKVTEK